MAVIFVTVRGSSGKIHYTLDGSDPRAPGGAPAASAREYAEALPVTKATRVIARVLRNGVWSGPTEARFTL